MAYKSRKQHRKSYKKISNTRRTRSRRGGDICSVCKKEFNRSEFTIGNMCFDCIAVRRRGLSYGNFTPRYS